MRKLVKKLALVLALVLAIGCIAPASAQAAEGVRRSWNFAPGEYKPTKTMTVDDAYTFELLDMGASIDTSIYDVAYWSKGDALEMSTSTGYAVAKAAAEDVKIVAVVTNKVTGNSVKVWAFVDIAAKEVVATATPTATVAPTEAPLALVDVTQTAVNQIVLTFNKDVTKTFKKADLLVTSTATLDSTAKSKYYINGTPVVEGSEVTVNLYGKIKADSFVHVDYKGCETFSFQASSGQVASIELITSEIAADIEGEGVPVEFALYDEKGIRLATLKANEEMPDGASCEVLLEGNTVDDEIIAEVNDGSVAFYEANHTVCVIVRYTFEDEDGEEVTIEGYNDVTSVDTTPVVSDVKWSVTTKAINKSHEASYGAYKLYVGDANYRLAGKVTLTLPRVDGNDKNVIVYTEQLAKEDNRYVIDGIDLEKLSYESNNTSVILVDGEGNLIPVQEGTAEIVVRFIVEDEETGEDVEGDIIGVYEVKVLEEREIASLKATIDKTKISNGPEAHEYATVTITAYDQHGNEFDLDDAACADIKIENHKDATNMSTLLANGYNTDIKPVSNKNTASFRIYGYNKNVADDPSTTGVDDCALKFGTYRFKVSLDEVVSNEVSFASKNVTANTTIKKWVLVKDTTVETKAQKYSSMTDEVSLVLNALDQNGYLVKTETITGLYNKNDKTVDPGSFWYDITLPYGNADDKIEFLDEARSKVVDIATLHTDPVENPTDDNTPDAADYPALTYTVDANNVYYAGSIYETSTIRFVPYEEGSEKATKLPDSLPVGDYEFTVYRFANGKYTKVDSAIVTVKDSQETLTATVVNLKIDGDYATNMANITINSDDSFTATLATGSALINNLIREDFEGEEGESGYCVMLWDGKTEINKRENAGTYQVVEVSGYTDRTRVTITTIKVKKTYSGGTIKYFDVPVNAGFTFAE